MYHISINEMFLLKNEKHPEIRFENANDTYLICYNSDTLSGTTPKPAITHVYTLIFRYTFYIYLLFYSIPGVYRDTLYIKSYIK